MNDHTLVRIPQTKIALALTLTLTSTACSKDVLKEHVRPLRLEAAPSGGPGWGSASGTTSVTAPLHPDPDAGLVSDASLTAPPNTQGPATPNPAASDSTRDAGTVDLDASTTAPSSSPSAASSLATTAPTNSSPAPGSSQPVSSAEPNIPGPDPSTTPAPSAVPTTEIPATPSAYERPFTKANLLSAIGTCALEGYREFVTFAKVLDDATQSFAASPDAAHVAVAREAWVAAMASWQRQEPFRFGPAAKVAEPGGQDLREAIYAFPLANYCKVDQQVVDGSYSADAFASSLPSARGLSTLEYLLFNESAGNACYSSLAINSTGAWNALGDEIWARRAAYAARTALDVREVADTLEHAWDPDGGNFLEQLAAAGESGSAYSSTQKAFNSVSNGMFYIEKELKDWKLGWPLGLVPDCVNAPGTCPNEYESRYARRSLDHVRQNLIGFRRIFEGCGPNYSGLGFDDWLKQIGAQDLAERMREELVQAQASVDTLEPSLEQLFASDPTRARTLHTELKHLTDLLKTEFITVLNLELPKGAEGDND
jgi:uncharacterized protein